MGDLLFFKSTFQGDHLVDNLLPGYCWEFWTPAKGGLLPKGIKKFPYLIWWSFHFFHIFFNRDYCVFLIKDSDGQIIHHSVVSPGYFRFPFMQDCDLQIGDVWTADSQRGKGLAVFAIKKILVVCGRPNRNFWYLVEKENVASIRAAEKAGLNLIGKGYRENRLGIRLFGYYAIAK